MSRQMWDERYRAAEYAYGVEVNDFLRAQAEHVQPGPVLCLAEGEGRNAVFLALRGHTVSAVDFSAEGLRKAQAELGGLDLVIARESERDIHEGRFHAGPSATVQLVGIRRA